MKTTVNKVNLKNLACGIGTTIALTGIIFMMAQMFPKIKLAEEKTETLKTGEIKIIDTELIAKLSDTSENKETTSRGSDEIRTAQSNEVQETSADTENNIETAVKEIEANTENNAQEKKKETETVKINENTTNNTNENINKSVAKTTSINEVKISKDMDLTVRTGLSREDFMKLIAGVKYDTSGFFEENAGMIYDLCEKYSINEIFFCGLISAESAWNIASNHRKTYNYISMMSNGKLIQFGSVDEGLEAAAKLLHKNYLTPGGSFYHGKTLSGVQKCFCPSGTWVDLVYGRMKQVLN